MKLQKIALNRLSASAQPRPLLTAEVDKLSASIKEVGLIQPITVSAFVEIAGIAEHGWQIVAGHHRVAACRALGWTEIDALVIEDVSHLQSELIEIDENLCRAELSPPQRTKYTKRRKQIWEALHPDDKQAGKDCRPVAKHGRAQDQGFAEATADATGQAARTTRLAIARADALGDETLDKITGTSLETGVEMDALAKLDAPERAQLVERAAAGERVSARTPAQIQPPKKPSKTLPLQLLRAVTGMVHSLGYANADALIEAIADLPELSKAEQATLDDALDIFMSIGELVPRAAEAV